MGKNPDRFERMSDGRLPRFSSYGGYSLFYLANVDEEHELCADCANEAGGSITSQNVNWEIPDLDCANCGEIIPATYTNGDEE